jgi:hypothetical protein
MDRWTTETIFHVKLHWLFYFQKSGTSLKWWRPKADHRMGNRNRQQGIQNFFLWVRLYVGALVMFLTVDNQALISGIDSAYPLGVPLLSNDPLPQADKMHQYQFLSRAFVLVLT